MDPVGIRESIRLLVAHGTDISFLDNTEEYPMDPFRQKRSSNPLETAILVNCAAMVDELLSIGKRNSISKSTNLSEYHDSAIESYSSRLESFSGQLLLLKSRYMPDILNRVIRRGESNIDVVRDLLRMEHEPGVIELKRLGADFLKPDWSGESPITIMVKWGFVSLMEKVGTEAFKMNRAWIQDTETTNVNLPGRLRPILHIACERALPNLEMIKLLVEKFGVDVNTENRNFYFSPRGSVLHILARAAYWWQPKALEYLIERGVDIEAKDSNGDTALLVASTKGYQNEYARINAIKVLLRAGGNPNALDKDSLTCLTRAAEEPELVRLLVEYGADPMLGRKPFIFDAIEAMDLDTIRTLIESGIHCNIQCQSEKEDESGDDEEDEEPHPFKSCRRTRLQYVQLEDDSIVENSYPIHLAASSKFNNDESKAKMIPIILTLLQGGADPFLICSNGDSVLHNLARQSGILESFLTLSNIDVEARDSKGRTLFLAACCSGGYWGSRQDITDHAVSLLVSHDASIDAVDNEGLNALHCVISSRKEYERISKSFEIILSLPDGPGLVVARDAVGCTPLHHALRNHSLDIVNTLLQHGADPTEPDPTDGSTALHHIAEGFFSCYIGDCNKHFRAFLARSLDINVRDSSGETALFRFVTTPSPASQGGQSSHMGTLPLFEEAGAEFRVRNDKGEGLLHRLASTKLAQGWQGKEQRADMVAMFRNLLEKGCDPAWEDEKQRTCLDVAAATGNQAVLELFQRKTITKIVSADGGVNDLPSSVL